MAWEYQEITVAFSSLSIDELPGMPIVQGMWHYIILFARFCYKSQIPKQNVAADEVF